MNFSLLDKIDEVSGGILATILKTEGSSYKKKGAKALFVVDDHFPRYGNLGSLCVDQDILSEGKAAFEARKPRVITIDTTMPEDIHFGYGTYCGGKMELLLEPIFEAHQEVYRQTRNLLEKGEAAYVVHDLTTGQLSVGAQEPAPQDGSIIEVIPPLRTLYIFGATPLAGRIARCAEEMEFDLNVVDWRSDYLDNFESVSGAKRHTDEVSFAKNALVVIISHSYHRDKMALKKAFAAQSAYIGLLSSKKRRDKLFEELRAEGISSNEIDRISCPVGIDIGGRTDPEIAVSIVAELVKFINQ